MKKYSGFLSEVELSELNEYIDKNYSNFKYYSVHMNLVNVKGWYGVSLKDPVISYFANKYMKAMGQNKYIQQLYFLEYGPDSFARVHEDNGTSLTSITILKQENLVGGETFFRNEFDHKKNPTEGKTYLSSARVLKHHYISVCPAEPGDAVAYGPREEHGVAYTHSGLRRVMAIWMKDKR